MFKELFAILLINILPGLCQEVKVDQGHKLQIVKQGDPVELSCKHYIETNYAMFWYQQKAGEGLQLMVYSTDANSGEMETLYKAWTFNRPHILNSTLRLAAADLQLSAVYFCAVSRHSCRQRITCRHKTCQSQRTRYIDDIQNYSQNGQQGEQFSVFSTL